MKVEEINIEKMIAADEGKSLKAYHCSEGYLTVGIGHNLDADPARHILRRGMMKGSVITERECAELFAYDLNKVHQGIEKRMPNFKTLERKYQIILINMIFQMGIDGVLAFKNTRAKMALSDEAGVKAGIRRSKYYKQTPNRAERMCMLVDGKVPKDYM